jgi:gamma-glutamyl-gamma-aminobutyrate hydrolase PuuD
MSKPSGKTVYIVDSSPQYRRMFEDNGFTIVDDVRDADLIQFTGGADVCPILYGETKHPKTFCSLDRDEYERGIWADAVTAGTPMAGICRGGQFLNVMCGGSMWQHVDGHAVGDHVATCNVTGATFTVSSTHHQMMRVSDVEEAKVLLVAREATYMEQSIDNVTKIHKPNGVMDIEAVVYPSLKCLCFQPHPEFFDSAHSCQKLYFKYVNNLLKGEL